MNEKNTFYFSHDYNVRADQKIKKLIRTHGMLGYGIYWAIIEDLYNNANALLLDCNGIAYDLHTEEKVVQSIIKDFGLFIVNNNSFSSESVGRRLAKMQETSENARIKAQKRWAKNPANATAMQQHSKSNAINNINKRNKEKNIEDIPSLFAQTLGRNPKPAEVELTEPLIEQFGMEKVYLAYKKAGLHGFKNLPNLIKRINSNGEFILEDDIKTITDDRFDKPIVRPN